MITTYRYRERDSEDRCGVKSIVSPPPLPPPSLALLDPRCYGRMRPRPVHEYMYGRYIAGPHTRHVVNRRPFSTAYISPIHLFTHKQAPAVRGVVNIFLCLMYIFGNVYFPTGRRIDMAFHFELLYTQLYLADRISPRTKEQQKNVCIIPAISSIQIKSIEQKNQIW